MSKIRTVARGIGKAVVGTAKFVGPHVRSAYVLSRAFGEGALQHLQEHKGFDEYVQARKEGDELFRKRMVDLKNRNAHLFHMPFAVVNYGGRIETRYTTNNGGRMVTTGQIIDLSDGSVAGYE